MLENNPKNQLEEKTDNLEMGDRAFKSLRKKERFIIDDVVRFWDGLSGDKIKTNAASGLLAFSLFTSASSVFAEGKGNENINLPNLDGEQISRAFEKSSIKNKLSPDYDLKNVVGKIEISLNGINENINDFQPEEITSRYYNSQALFYSSLNGSSALDAYNAGFFAVTNSQNSDEFFNNLKLRSQNLNEKQKILILQQIGGVFSDIYNYDMYNSFEHIIISYDEMFGVFKNKYMNPRLDYESGTCGNSAAFLSKVANAMGIESWLQSGSTKTGSHIFNGFISNDGENKEIVWLDNYKLLTTGTLNYEHALGISERKRGAITIFNNYVGNEKEVLFPVKSIASKIVEKAVNLKGSMNTLEKNLNNGEIVRDGRGLYLSINPEIKEIKLNSDMVGISFFKFDDFYNNSYQSLKSLDAESIYINTGNKNLNFDADVTVLNMNIKDLGNSTNSVSEIIGKLAINYVDNKQLTKNQYGEFVLNWGATLEGVVKLPSKGESLKTNLKTKGMENESLGLGMIWVDPNHVNKIYISAFGSVRGQTNNFQDQENINKLVEEKFVIGTNIRVHEGEFGLEIGKSNNDWGKVYSVKTSVIENNFKGELNYEKKESDYERFIPSSEKVEAGIGYQFNPKYVAYVTGFKNTEKYKDADINNIYGAEVKLKINLF